MEFDAETWLLAVVGWSWVRRRGGTAAGCSCGSGLCCRMPRDASKVCEVLGIAVVVVGCVGKGLPAMGSHGGCGRWRLVEA